MNAVLRQTAGLDVAIEEDDRVAVLGQHFRRKQTSGTRSQHEDCLQDLESDLKGSPVIRKPL